MAWQAIANGVHFQSGSGYYDIRVTNTSGTQSSPVAPTIVPFVMPYKGKWPGRKKAPLVDIFEKEAPHFENTQYDPSNWQLVAAINGTFFDQTSGAVLGPVGSYSSVLENASEFAPLATTRRSYFGWDGNYQVAADDAKPYVTGDVGTDPDQTAKYLFSQNVRQFMGGCGILLRNGNLMSPPNHNPNWGVRQVPTNPGGQNLLNQANGHQRRTAIGIEPDLSRPHYPKYVYMVVAPHGTSTKTTPDLANHLLGLGATDAVFLDGGHSSQLCYTRADTSATHAYATHVEADLEGYNYRALPSAILIYAKPLTAGYIWPHP